MQVLNIGEVGIVMHFTRYDKLIQDGAYVADRLYLRLDLPPYPSLVTICESSWTVTPN
jgi:hypothetical protein